jgi:16S rRNA pseudouridine516 synthase
MRVDKFLAGIERIPRRHIKHELKKKSVFINQTICVDPGSLLAEGDTVFWLSQKVIFKEFIYLMIHKPQGVICSDRDEHGRKSYRQLLIDCPYAPLVHVAGRLDQDSTGLILASNDGQRIHDLISPKKEEYKTYIVTLRDLVSTNDIEQLKQGIVLDDDYTTLPAQAQLLESHKVQLSITEGKYHQVKRMFEALGNQVTGLHRTSIGKYELGDLKVGERREIGN